MHRTAGNPVVALKETRRILFGQHDHVRRYGNDIFRRFCRTGVTFVGGDHATLRLPMFGVNAGAPFFLFQK